MKASSPYYPGRCGYMFPIIVKADGTFELGPHGWECNKTGVGLYEIVHNIGVLKYLAVPGVFAQGNYKLNTAIETLEENRVVVRVTDSTQLADGGFVMLIIGL